MHLAMRGERPECRAKPSAAKMREEIMSKHDEGRRAFLVGAVGAGAVASTNLVQAAYAKTPVRAPVHQPPPKTAEAPDTSVVDNGDAHGAFFNDDNAATVAALAERLMPSAPGKPGAHDAGVLNYIDLALAGAYADQQDFYRRGLAQLDAYCRKAHNQPFVKLGPAQQDEVIGAMEQGKASEFTYPTAPAFFNTLRTHTMEGMFADPVYGGNKDFAGWRLVGFPGTRLYYTPADMASKQAFTRAPIIGLQSQAKAPTRKV
jgi:gluconate 2-dehydrogenase gamma chain